MRQSDFFNLADANDAAEVYIDQGWNPVPIPKGEKGPEIANWQGGGFKQEDIEKDLESRKTT